MKDYIESLATGQYKILFWFIIAILFIYIPFVRVYLSKRKEKGREFEHDHRDAVKIYFKIDLTGTLQVYSVNGEDPVPFYETFRQGIYVLPGKNVIGVQYHWAQKDVFSLKGFKDHNIQPEELPIDIEEGKTYQIGFNHDLQRYEFEELSN